MATRIRLTPVIPVLTGRIVEWEKGKGYGFVETGEGRLFLHRHDFAEWWKRPKTGDQVQFVVGTDSKGRICARKAMHVNGGGRLTIVNFLILLALLALPGLALARRTSDLLYAVGYVVVISGLTYWAYMRDKRKAGTGGWRTPEAHLHLLELLGGWPAAFLAQRRLRHKISKTSYQVVFWLIVLLYQFAALDSLQDWRVSKAVWTRIGAAAQHQGS